MRCLFAQLGTLCMISSPHLNNCLVDSLYNQLKPNSTRKNQHYKLCTQLGPETLVQILQHIECMLAIPRRMRKFQAHKQSKSKISPTLKISQSSSLRRLKH